MSFKSVDSNSILMGVSLLGLGCLPILMIVLAVRASKPKDRSLTFEETYPDSHLFI